MNSRSTLLAALLLFGASPAFSAPEEESPFISGNEVHPPTQIPEDLEPSPRRQPWPILLLIKPSKRGMFIRLPIVDTDPNRGVTFGIMPIWVLQGKNESRIRHIHAPSLTYNQTFRFIPTYRYYYYPTPKANYQLRGSLSAFEDRELMAQMEDWDFLGRDIAATIRLQFDVDGSKRFFGIGPDSSRDAETNFTRKIMHYRARLGLPLFQDSGLRFNIQHHMAGVRLAAGVMDELPDIGVKFPERTPGHWHQDAEMQLFIDYDTRDDATTTTRGSYVKFMIENSQKGWGSEYAFQRYGIDLRHFHKPSDDSWHATAGRLRYEQLMGTAPFYLMPSLGGKYLHRAYGEGRYIDRGMWTSTVEERFTVYSVEVSGVTTEIEVAPFVGAGTVFSSPKRMASRFELAGLAHEEAGFPVRAAGLRSRVPRPGAPAGRGLRRHRHRPGRPGRVHGHQLLLLTVPGT
ncbi:BamA/TamA family outer membrane protein [Elusimicrobiota bacterium]